jgi:uncharacterized protein (TIGR02594 family)
MSAKSYGDNPPSQLTVAIRRYWREVLRARMTQMPSTELAPPWLMVMRSITGMTETPGSGNNPQIMHMADTIAKKYPHQAEYCSYYTGDDVAWCGLAVAYCTTMSDIEPVFGDTDTERWMWAQAWADWPQSTELAEPQLGAIIVTTRDGGGHVTMYEGKGSSSGYWACRGGNQSDMVKVSDIAISSVIKVVWPRLKAPPQIGLEPQEIAWVQASLNHLDDANLELDGEMGPLTTGAIQSYQHAHILPLTGVADKRTVDAMLVDLEMWNTGRGTK